MTPTINTLNLLGGMGLVGLPCALPCAADGMHFPCHWTPEAHQMHALRPLGANIRQVTHP